MFYFINFLKVFKGNILIFGVIIFHKTAIFYIYTCLIRLILLAVIKEITIFCISNYKKFYILALVIYNFFIFLYQVI